MSKEGNQWVQEKILAFNQVLPRYARMAQVLDEILKSACKEIAPLAIIQTRAKSISSFMEKAIRKRNMGRYDDPLLQMTDLCGGRIITQTLAEVHAFSELIEKHFLVDEKNSVNAGERHKPSEFGYRSIHYIIQFKPGPFSYQGKQIEIPEELYPDASTPMNAEIQVRTFLEHAWAGFVHDRVYKSAFTIPPKWERELAGLAGMLEQTDQSFSRIQAGLRTYAASYGAYLSESQLQDEIEILEAVLTCDSENPDLAHRIGKLAMEQGDLKKAIAIFTRYVPTGYQPILRDLGVALCKEYSSDPQGELYKQGQKYLEQASAPVHRDSDALASLAGTWKKLNEEKTRELYRQAFELDPADPYAVSNYLVYEIIHHGDLTPASLMAPTLMAAIQRCHDQADVGMNMPWAFYNLGIFHLLLGHPYESLNAYAKAIQVSTTDWMIETSMRLLDKLSVVRSMVPGYDWVRQLLTLGRAVRFHDRASRKQVRQQATAGVSALLARPVVIVAGGTSVEIKMDEYHQLLLGGFRHFHGTLLGGGTRSGISGLVGDVQAAYPQSIATLGYLPAALPPGTEIDPHYQHECRTQGQDFSALEPLQYWTDIVAAGIPLTQVKLIGINGGEISAFEYRLALMLGARVGVIESSGREAACLFKDTYWENSRKLTKLAPKKGELRSFLLLKR